MVFMSHATDQEAASGSFQDAEHFGGAWEGTALRAGSTEEPKKKRPWKEFDLSLFTWNSAWGFARAEDADH